MRCLYCSKKLSLLKLAKGDSFCSPEHFDAFQLQESKNAIQRLMSLGEPETPKAPLVLKHVEPETKPVEIEVKPVAPAPPEPQPARLESRPATVEPRPAPVEAAQVIENTEPVAPPPVKKVEPQGPPCAPFADQGRPVSFDAPHNIANLEKSENPILPEVRPVAWPIHEVHAAEGILNLHLQLQLAGIEPTAWDSPREFAAEDQPFAPAVEHPSMDAKPELPRIEYVAPDEFEAPVEKIEAPAAKIGAPAEIIEAPAANIATPLVEAKASETIVEVPPAKLEPRAPSIPYLLSPSFLARSGSARFLEPAQAPTVNGFSIPSPAGRREIPGIEAREMPRYARPAKTASIAAWNFVPRSTATVGELPTIPARTFPAAQKNVSGSAWTVSNRLIALPVRTLNAILPKPRSADFDLPRPASFLVRPDPAAIRAIDPQKMARGLDTKTALRGGLEIVPSETKWTIFPAAGSFDGAVMPMLPQSLDQPVSPGLPWTSSTNAFAREYPIAPHEITRTPALRALVYSAAPVHPSPYWVVSAARAPWQFASEYRGLRSHHLDAFLEGRPAAYGAIVHISMKRLGHAPIPPRSLGGNTVGFLANWEAWLPEPLERRTARFLPVRDTQHLPAARPWPKLGALPR